MVCRTGEDVLVKSTVVVAKISVYLGLTRYVNLKIAYGVYMDPVIPFDQFARLVLDTHRVTILQTLLRRIRTRASHSGL
jgi:hypothetical protein